MAKILYITTSYILKNSSAAIRNNSVVKGFTQLGYEVDVYTLEWSKELYSPFFKEESNGNINYSRLSNLNRIATIKKRVKDNNKYITKFKQFIKKILFFPDECSEWIKIFDYKNIPFEKYDYLITSSDHKTSHFIGHEIKRQNKKLSWIQIWGDPWSSDLGTLYCMKGITAYYERKLLKASDYVIYVSSITADIMKKKYPYLASKIYYIPRSYYPTKIDNPPINTENEIVKIIYTGLISSGRNVFHLLDTINESEFYSKKIHVHIYGSISNEIKEKLNTYSFVKYFNGVDFEYMNSIYESASILLFLSNKGGASQIPGKFFDYMGTTKPILCLMEDSKDEVSRFLRNYERCLVINNTDEEIRLNLDTICNYSKNSYKPDIEFAPEAIAAKIIQSFNKNFNRNV